MRYIYHLFGLCVCHVMRGIAGSGNPVTISDVVGWSYHLFSQRYLNGTMMMVDGLTRRQRRLLTRRNHRLLELTPLFNANIQHSFLENREIIQELTSIAFKTLILNRAQNIRLGQIKQEISILMHQEVICYQNLDNSLVSFDPVIMANSIMACLNVQFANGRSALCEYFIHRFDLIIPLLLEEMLLTHPIEVEEDFKINLIDNLIVLANTHQDQYISEKVRQFITGL